MSAPDLATAGFIFLAALLYSAVGHGGASAYLAVMALAGLSPDVMKPSALLLNVVVAGVAAWWFARAGYLSWPLLWPFAVASVPAAFLGGFLTLPARWYQIVLGGVLAYAGIRMLLQRRIATEDEARRPSMPVALGAGAGIGLLSGLVGIGGGIFLSPLLLLLGWAGPRGTAGTSAAFILVNSLAGLAGHLLRAPALPAALPVWAGFALAGGWTGARFGSIVMPAGALLRLLALVLLLASVKLVLLS